MITISDFKNMGLKVGKIIEVSDHPNAEKLYVLKVDLGTEKRTLVAGLKKYYSKKELMNRQVVVVTNLAPANLRGIISEGMLLASQDKNKDIVSIISPDKEVAPGSEVL